MFDLLYWTTRVVLVGAWLVVAVRASARRRSRPAFWLGCAFAAFAFASMRAWPWNYALLAAGRAGLQQGGVYEQRLSLKLFLAGVLVLAVAAGAWSLRRVVREPGALACCIGLGLQGVLLAIETMSLDEMIPQWVVHQPGRYLTEGCFALCALLALRRRTEAR